jgi:hypothetical protein
MGGQACVFYGAAQFSKDVDLALLAEEENFTRLRAALDELQAVRIAVPRFDPALLARGHAVHFRCQCPEASGLRVDVMTRLRDLPEFPALWARRTTVTEESGDRFDLMAVEDLVQAKKTQRSRPNLSSSQPSACSRSLAGNRLLRLSRHPPPPQPANGRGCRCWAWIMRANLLQRGQKN